MNKTRTWIALPLLLAAGATSACADEDPGTSTDDENAETRDAGSDDETAVGDPRSGAEAGSDAAADVSDGEIGAVTSAANAGEIAQANAALPKLVSAEARAFAMQMISEHGAAQTRQSALLQAKNIAPRESAVSMMLKQDSDTIVAALSVTAGAETDAVYIDAQVDVHTAVLSLLDSVLIPSADDADLLAELRTTRTAVNGHLDHARQIRAALSP